MVENEGKMKDNEPFFSQGSLMKVSSPIRLVEVNEGNEPFLPPMIFLTLSWVFFTTPPIILHYLHCYILKHYLSMQKTMNLSKKITFI